jgi:hypothetical protein
MLGIFCQNDLSPLTDDVINISNNITGFYSAAAIHVHRFFVAWQHFNA